MKKTITIIAFMCLSFFDMSAACYQSFKTSRGTPHANGPMTYKDVTETILGNYFVLNCDMPGSSKCEFEDGTPGIHITVGGFPVTYEEAENEAKMQIQSGVLSGTVNGDDGVGQYTWNAVSIDEYMFEMCDGL